MKPVTLWVRPASTVILNIFVTWRLKKRDFYSWENDKKKMTKKSFLHGNFGRKNAKPKLSQTLSTYVRGIYPPPKKKKETEQEYNLISTVHFSTMKYLLQQQAHKIGWTTYLNSSVTRILTFQRILLTKSETKKTYKKSDPILWFRCTTPSIGQIWGEVAVAWCI